MQPTVVYAAQGISPASTLSLQRICSYFLTRPAAAVLLCAMVSACEAPRKPHVPPSQGHIMAPPPKAETAQQDIPPPARVSTFVPPPQPTVKPQTYSVVVNEVPVKELLLALSRDTKQNIDVHPGI